MTDIWQSLKEPFPPDKVSWRVGATNKDKTKGLALAYIDARDVMERLDAVVGPENWQNKYSHANGKTVCDIGVQFGVGNWVWKADGAGDTDTEAEKGALSDAFKRAAVRFGIGRYLYDIGDTWAELEERGRSYVIKSSEFAKLRARLPSPTDVPANQSLPPIHNNTKSNSRDEFQELCREVNNINSLAELQRWKLNPDNATRIEALNETLFFNFKDTFQQRSRELKEKAAA